MKINVTGCSEQGYSHKKHTPELPCQDSNYTREIENGTVVAAVADGHGSSSCLYSDIGAKLSAESFYEIMKELYLENKKNDGDYSQLYTFLHRDGGIQVTKKIVKIWREKVRKQFEIVRTKHDEEEPGKYPPYDPDSIDDDLDKTKNIYHLYGTTLVGMLITPEFHYALQIGDGDIARINNDGQAAIFLEGDNILGVETHSLCENDPWKWAHSKLIHSSNEDTFSYVLSSDGFKNSHASEADYLKSCKEYVEVSRNHSKEEFEAALSKWLFETSEYGCGDDITMVIIDSYDPVCTTVIKTAEQENAGQSSLIQDDCINRNTGHTETLGENPWNETDTGYARMLTTKCEQKEVAFEEKRSGDMQESEISSVIQEVQEAAAQEPEQRDDTEPGATEDLHPSNSEENYKTKDQISSDNKTS